MAKDLAGLAKEMSGAPKVLRAEMRRAVQQGGLVLEQAARRRQPPSGQLRNVGSSGARIGVTSSVRGTERPASLIRATGPLHLLDNPTKAHAIIPRRKRAVMTPDGPRRRSSTRGTTGKRTFERGIAQGLPQARQIVEDAFRRAPSLFR